MRITIGKLRRIIRESIVSELNIQARNTGLEELADILGFDWYTLTSNEKKNLGDLMGGIMNKTNDKNIMLMLRELPLEKNFIVSKPGGKYGSADDVDKNVSISSLLQKIKINYMN